MHAFAIMGGTPKYSLVLLELNMYNLCELHDNYQHTSLLNAQIEHIVQRNTYIHTHTHTHTYAQTNSIFSHKSNQI